MSRARVDSEPTLEQAFALLQELASMGKAPGRDASPFGAATLAAPPIPVAESLREPPTGAFILDQDGCILHLDGGAERVFRCEAEEMVGARMAPLLLGDLPGGEEPVEMLCRRRDGSTFPAELTRSQFRQGTEVLILVSVRDKEGLAHSAAEKRESELRFRNLVEQIPAVTFTAVLHGGVLGEIYVSPQIESLLGYSQQEWVSNPVLWYDRLHPDDRSKLDGEFARGCMTGGPFRAECRFIARGGSVVWVHGEARIIRDGAGRPLFLQGVAFNVTDIRRLHEEQAARAAVELEHRREELLSHISLALAREFAEAVPFQAVADFLAPVFCDWCVIDAVDDDSVARRAAVAHAARSDAQLVEAISRRVPDWHLSPGAPDGSPLAAATVLVTESTAAGFDPEAARILELLGGGSMMVVPLRAHGRVLGVLSLLSGPTRQSFGDDDLRFGDRLAERVATLLDNRRLYQQAQEAIQARDAIVSDLERAVHFSEMFVGILGHDLRNPLGSIITAATLLQRRAEDEALIRPVGRIFSSAERMRRMIDQILDFTHIRLGRGLPLQRGEVDLAALCRSAADELLDDGQAPSVRLVAFGDTGGSWDPDRLGQLVSNLVGNALQHRAGSGPVEVRVNGSDPHTVTLEVWNEGVVPAELLPVLFEPLRSGRGKQVGSSGLGLGLFISREIARAHGGTIEVSSSEGEGTCLTLCLPRRRPRRRRAATTSQRNADE